MHALFALALLLPSCYGHGFISKVTVNGVTTQAQKTSIQNSSFRAVSDSTGWQGSDFFSDDSIICGSSDTPFGRVAAPGGTIFADASQSAGQTPVVSAGSTVTLHVAGNPGEGWPHPNGHLQAYLGSCGASCQNFDVRGAKFFKIQGILNGVPAMRATFDKAADSNSWPITIPKNVANGKYILRSEIWAYGQSSPAEGFQVQLYPYCMNIEVTNGGNANPATVSFPSEYANDKDKIVSQGLNFLPGPLINVAFGGSDPNTGAGTGGTGSFSTPSPAPAPAQGSSPSPAPVAASPPSSPAPAPAPVAAPPSNKNAPANDGDKTRRKGSKGSSSCSAEKKKHRHHHHRHGKGHRRHHARAELESQV